jgi:hypothetical protein
MCCASTVITIDPKHSKRNPGGFHHFMRSRGNHGDALEMSKPLVLTVTVVFDASSRSTGLGAELSELSQLGHNVHAPSRCSFM